MTSYKAVPYTVDALQYDGTNLADVVDFTDGDLTGSASPVAPGTWFVKDPLDPSDYSMIPDDQFKNRFVETEAGCVSFAMETKTDQAVVTVEGYKEGATVVRALTHTATPEVLMQVIEEFIRSGDMSMVELAQQLGELAEARNNNSRK